MSIPEQRSQHLRQLATGIVSRLRHAGHIALFAGGCVRDQLLRTPPHDYDIATDAHPDQVRLLFEKTLPIGAQFGVMLVVEQGNPFQVATFRAERDYVDHRHPKEISFGTPEQDAFRRDFTVNGLFEDPFDGTIFDYVGGRADLEKGIIRCIGNATDRLEEDRLRVMRAIRLAATLDFQIHPNTWEALTGCSSNLNEISAERIREEFNRILLSPRRIQGFDLLDESDVLRTLLPEVEALKGCKQPPEFHPEGDVFTHTRLTLASLRAWAPLHLVLATLFHDIGKPGTAHEDQAGRIRFNTHEKLGAEITLKIMKRLRYSNTEIEITQTLIRNHMAFKDVQNMRPSTLKRFLARQNFEDELELHRVDCLSSHGSLSNYEFLIAKRAEFSHAPLVPTALISGKDLLTLNWKPGPQFKTALEVAYNAQLEGLLSSKEEAIAFVLEKFPNP
ncbi:MAG: CCA tRNA nucleotidyltransferase [Candidatus Xiphinematobacter sp.]|nr:MAG: CCA tRNA nucleotidyltransferase [Candidatus Xiphinematobacter sp.]